MKAEDAKKLMDAATQGEWVGDGFKGVCAMSDQLNGGYFIAECSGKDAWHNAQLIAALPEITNAYLATSALCKKEQKYNDELEQEVDELKRRNQALEEENDTFRAVLDDL